MHRAVPLAPCVARFPHSWSPTPAAKHTYIDALNGKTVTPETLLRYTFKSHLVNILIRGFLWKTGGKGLISLQAGEAGVASALSQGVAALGMGGLFLTPKHPKKSLGHGRGLLGDFRP